jgi:DNA-binding transcriptional LysR family regulator
MLSNAIDLLVDVATDGGGIVYLPEYMAHEPLRLGRLRIVLPQYRLEPTAAQIVYPRHRAQAPGVAAFVELLLDIFDSRRATVMRPRRMAPA